MTSEEASGIECQIDHIVPRSRGGQTASDNLCLACVACNGRKYARTVATDPDTGDEVPLFDPRRQNWREHFRWGSDGTRVVGLTATGRATIAALQMNDALIVAARSLWVGMGAHPPR